MANTKLYRTSMYTLIGSISLFAGIGFILYASWIVKAVIDAVLVLKPDTFVFNLWRKPPTLNKLSIYMFNWTNHHEVFNNNTKPKFEEIGPYIYYEQLDKKDVIFNDNDTLTYKLTKSWYFDEKNSRNLNDSLITVNTLAALVAEKTKDLNFFYKRMISTVLATLNVKVHVKRRADELLFKGYSDNMIDAINQLPKFLFDFSNMPQMDKFGWFYKANGTNLNGIYNIGRGHQYQIGEFKEWNYKNVTPYGNGPCGNVIGTTGEIFKRPTYEDRLTIFTPDLCKYSFLNYLDDTKSDGIMCRRYVLSPDTFDNGTFYKENKCFCEDHQCMPNGAADISRCRYGVPAAVSFPHFFAADPYYLQSIEGLKPDKNKHNFYVYIDPLTGVPVRVVGRLQMNILVQPVEDVTIFENLPKFYLPVMWFEVDGGLPNVLLVAIKILNWGTTILVTFGTILLIISLMLFTKLANSINKRNITLATLKTHIYQAKKELEPLNSIRSGEPLIK